MKVLYVEDNPANVFLVKRVARMGKHEIVNYIDGDQALAKYDDIAPDLVLMDIQLAGGQSGLDIVKQLRSRGVKTPIIAVTAYAMVGDKERCLEAGCDDYLAKPLPVPRLVELFEHYETLTAQAKQSISDTLDQTELDPISISTDDTHASRPSGMDDLDRIELDEVSLATDETIKHGLDATEPDVIDDDSTAEDHKPDSAITDETDTTATNMPPQPVVDTKQPDIAEEDDPVLKTTDETDTKVALETTPEDDTTSEDTTPPSETQSSMDERNPTNTL